MGARNREGKPLKFYSLKAKVDKENSPYFVVSEKIDGRWKNTEQFTEVFGTVTKAEVTEREFEGVKSDLFNITLSDEDENSVIQMTQNQVTYSIINSLLSLEDFDGELSIRVYKTEDESDNGKVYYNGRAYVTIDGERLDWTVNVKDDAPKPEPVMNGTKPFMQNGKQVYDHTEVHEFWKEKFLEFANAIPEKTTSKSKKEDVEEDEQEEAPKTKSTSKPTSKSQNSKKVTQSPVEEDDDDDLPF